MKFIISQIFDFVPPIIIIIIIIKYTYTRIY